jgi:hypothetical protein
MENSEIYLRVFLYLFRFVVFVEWANLQISTQKVANTCHPFSSFNVDPSTTTITLPFTSMEFTLPSGRQAKLSHSVDGNKVPLNLHTIRRKIIRAPF